MKPPILHIGQPKTGSSALQRFLLLNRKVLATHGFYYPSHRVDKNGVSSGHVQFFRLMNAKRLEELAPYMRLVVQVVGHLTRRYWMLRARLTGKQLLLSSEIMAARPAATHTFFAGSKIIAFYRNPASKLVASYNQGIKRAGLTERFSDFIGRHSKPNRQISGIIFREWAKAFGHDNLTVMPYAREAFPEGKIELAFLQYLGIAAEYWSQFTIPEGVLNSSLPLEALEFKRLINQLEVTEQGNVTWQLDFALQNYADSQAHNPAVLLTALDLEKVRRSYQTAVSEVEARYMPSHYQGFVSGQDVTVRAAPVSSEAIDFDSVIDFLRDEEPSLFRQLKDKILSADEYQTDDPGLGVLQKNMKAL